ncbi:zinc metalloprotease [Halorussus pelagicus]|uniref:matrixin n=1 Tax=Halorussus pelagicus TaxID=2505977 RepID=UPI000FFBABD7|nr:matrixin [Halorussus pelagicus]
MPTMRTLAVVALVVLAGCSGPLQESATTTAVPDTATATTPPVTTSTFDTGTTVRATTTTPTTTPTPTASTTTIEQRPADNPWGRQKVTVAVRNTADQSRDIAPLVEQTLAYWNGEGSEYAGYEVTFVRATNPRDADIVVESVDEVTECDGEDTDSAVGCAPLLDARSTPETPARVEVVAGYSNESTRTILRHEFGHVLGIEHGEEPMPTMQAISSFTYLSQPDLADRAVPWKNDTLAVHIDLSGLPGHDRDAAREQVRHALDYYESGADGAVPSNVSFERTSNRSAVDVRIDFPDDPFDCGSERVREGSCGSAWTYDTDTDDAPEYFAQYDIRVRGLETEAVGWHVGYWLANALGLGEDELPAPFVDAGRDDRRGEWWTT